MLRVTSQRVLLLFSFISIVSASVIFVVLKTHTALSILSVDLQTVLRFYSPALALLLGISITALYLSRYEFEEGLEVSRTQPKWLVPFKWGINVAILLQCVWLLKSTHMYYDERGVGSLVATKSFTDLVVFLFREFQIFGSSTQHYVTLVASEIITNTIGVSEIKIRLGALVFTILFLYSIYCYSKKFLGTAASVFLYLNLACNYSVLWNFIVARGYSAFLFSSLLLYWLSQDLIGGAAQTRQKNALFFVGMFVLVLSNGSGSVLAFTLSLSLAVWYIANRGFKTSELGRGILTYVGIAAIFAPVGLFILLKERLLLHATMIPGGEIPLDSFSFALIGQLMGAAHGYFGKLGALLFLGLLFIRVYKNGWRCLSDFTFVFAAVSLLVYIVLLNVLNPPIFYIRYILGYLVPLICFMVQEVERLGTKQRTVGYVFLVFSLVIIPLAQRNVIQKDVHSHVFEFDSFLAKVGEFTQSEKTKCYLAEGSVKEMAWISIYLPISRTPNCEENYLLMLPEEKSGPKDYKIKQELYRDAHNRAFYELASN